MLIDNRSSSKVVDVLAESLRPGARVSVLSSDLSVYALDALGAEIEGVAELRLLIAPPTGAASHGPSSPTLLPTLLGGADDRRFRNTLDCAHQAKRWAEWLATKAEIRRLDGPAPQNVFLVESPDGDSLCVHGSSAFTTTGLGVNLEAGIQMNTLVTEPEEVASLGAWFDRLWQDSNLASEFKQGLLEELRRIAADKSPEQVYFLMLHNLFRDGLDDLDEERIIKTRTGIKDTRIWSKLYRFQRDGVLGAIDKIEKHNGCIIADSVGLGKTFEALAIIKYYELRNDRVLVMCPKKLRENWTLYTVNDKRNILAADRLNYDVLNHTDLSRDRGKSGEINLETLNWGNYDLVVIDESHNFRNNPPRKDGLTRYSRLMRDIIQAGVKTKVLMLSATPVNSRMNDLKNQVAFITEGADDALYGVGVPSIEQTLRKAQARFNEWLKSDAATRSAEDLVDALNLDYFKLLDTLTIARSRKHIEKYYDLAEIGAFPERNKPINIKADIDTERRFPELREINRDIRRLNLSAYAPLKYVLPAKLEEYGRKYDRVVAGGSVFKQLDREESLIHLMRVNLLKRMESSIHSFALTLGRLLGGVRELIERIDSHDPGVIEELSIEDIEVEDEAFDPYLVGDKIKVLIQDVDRIRWRQELEEDRDLLVKLLRAARDVSADRDAKLRALKQALVTKCSNPLNPGNHKAIVFTAFADTAEYLYQNLAEWAREELGIHVALVTGRSGGNRATLPHVRKDIASIITTFSPLSKERAVIDEDAADEIDLLIATDCISEGQNLQDCDYLVNYDIHWNPVRIIQRFGRIDRLGSRNERIQLVNFWPNLELDEYIDLEARVSGRMVLLDISATGEENIIEYADAGKMNDLEYRRQQMQRLQNEVLDLEDLGGGISITDMTFNDFRLDLLDYLKDHTEKIERMDLGAYAVAVPDDLMTIEGLAGGAVFCLRGDQSKATSDGVYALAPHYLAYVRDDGQVLFGANQARQILAALKSLTLGRARPDPSAVERFQSKTKAGVDMRHYRQLLAAAADAISGKEAERGVESLFEPGGTLLTKESFRGVEDFELVAYVVVLDEGAAA